MPKRRGENSKEEKYKKKVKKWQKKLEKVNEVRSPSPAPSSPVALSPSPTPSMVVHQDENIDHTADDTLDELIIKALGQASSTDKDYGPEVHTELVKRVEGIITQGLKKEEKEDLMKKILIPSNAKLLDAPKLNKELEGLLNDSMKARDKRVEDRQQQIGVATAALLSTTDKLIKDDVDKIKLISNISDVTRLLLDLHHQDTVTRKKLIVPNLEKNIGKTVEAQKRDEFLFGDKFNENVKAATAIKKSATNILKQNNNRKNTSSNRSNQLQQYPKKQGNFRAPPRAHVTQFKQGGGGRYQQQAQYSQKPRPPPRAPAKTSVRQT